MKYILAGLSLFLCSCSSVRFITIDKGQVVTQNNKPVEVIGNPVVVCHSLNSTYLVEGYFVYQRDDSSFLIDEYGKKFVLVRNPVCTLGPSK